MAERPPMEVVPSAPPREFPSVTPQDLHPTSDIRFVMVEIAKLSSSVERLIDDVKVQGEKLDAVRIQTSSIDRLVTDVKSQSEKLDVVRHQITYVKGGIKVAVVVLGLLGAIGTLFLTGKLNAILASVAEVSK